MLILLQDARNINSSSAKCMNEKTQLHMPVSRYEKSSTKTRKRMPESRTEYAFPTETPFDDGAPCKNRKGFNHYRVACFCFSWKHRIHLSPFSFRPIFTIIPCLRLNHAAKDVRSIYIQERRGLSAAEKKLIVGSCVSTSVLVSAFRTVLRREILGAGVAYCSMARCPGR